MGQYLPLALALYTTCNHSYCNDGAALFHRGHQQSFWSSQHGRDRKSILDTAFGFVCSKVWLRCLEGVPSSFPGFKTLLWVLLDHLTFFGAAHNGDAHPNRDIGLI